MWSQFPTMFVNFIGQVFPNLFVDNDSTLLRQEKINKDETVSLLSLIPPLRDTIQSILSIVELFALDITRLELSTQSKRTEYIIFDYEHLLEAAVFSLMLSKLAKRCIGRFKLWVYLCFVLAFVVLLLVSRFLSIKDKQL